MHHEQADGEEGQMKNVILSFLLVFLLTTSLKADINLPKGLKGTSIGALWYLDFKAGGDRTGKHYLSLIHISEPTRPY